MNYDWRKLHFDNEFCKGVVVNNNKGNITVNGNLKISSSNVKIVYGLQIHQLSTIHLVDLLYHLLHQTKLFHKWLILERLTQLVTALNLNYFIQIVTM